ncbi:hypothetical protein PR048_006172 [Dryococelus australis]|uniref:Uncharacterized protein n=1 Tax=Dryococelus australis TaxID=614101 RepID=A0ABQ9IAS7_9NEOP|nr:hypothetical protein PR048_006172 [Dryococelus australis]
MEQDASWKEMFRPITSRLGNLQETVHPATAEMRTEQDIEPRCMLTVIDCFSQYSWVILVRQKCALDVGDSNKTVLNDMGSSKHLQMDLGREFYKPSFRSQMAMNKTNTYSSYGEMKTSIVDLFNRTLKTEMW